MRADRNDGSKFAAALLAAALLLFGGAPAAAQPSMSRDFERMMQWLSHELAQGLAFSAGSTTDPPREIIDKRLAPDLSLGLGKVPFDKTRFPTPETPALSEMNVSEIFPEKVHFPNLAMHLRAGLPWRSDFAIRFANMTTPPGYKLSDTTSGKGQSNSIGLTVRRHWFGGRYPLLTGGIHLNHVYGRFGLKTKFKINDINGFSADSDVNGDLQWNINSLGVNLVTSQQFGLWTPFFGLGYNRTSGSVRSRLEATPNTFAISPIVGEGAEKPEQNQGRVIFGGEMNSSWMNLFLNVELKAIGISSSRSWVAHTGIQLPFKIGVGGAQGYKDSARRRAKFAKAPIVLDEDERDSLRSALNDDQPVKRRKKRKFPVHREVFRGGDIPEPSNDASPELIFIQ